jgi:hypothetical protein
MTGLSVSVAWGEGCERSALVAFEVRFYKKGDCGILCV